MTLSPTAIGLDTLPTRTEVAMLHGRADIRVETIDLPAVGPSDLLVEMASGGICGSDMHYFSDGRNGQNELRAPVVLGHEAAGVVVAAGSSTVIAPGTTVVIEPAMPCGTCPSCQSGRYNVCPFGTCFGSPPTNGLFARFAVVPEPAVHVLPGSILAALGAVIEPLAVAVWAVQRARVSPSDHLLITGAGPIGLLVAQVARASGVREITVTDVNDARLEAALSFGVTRAINTSENPLSMTGLDRLIECSGSPQALAAGIQTLRPTGVATVVGQARASMDGLPLAYMQRYEIDLVTAFRYAEAFPTAISLVDSGQVALEEIVTARYPLERIEEALLAASRDTTNLKVLVTY